MATGITRHRAEQIVHLLRRLLGPVPEDALLDVASGMEWVELEGGARLIRQDEPADCMYVLVSGRLRAVVRGEDGVDRVVGEIARGEVVGEIALLTDEPRSASIDAVRDCNLARLTRESFERLGERHPDFLLNLSRVVIRRLARSQRSGPADGGRIETVAVLCTGQVPAAASFVQRLEQALATHGSVLRLGSVTLQTIADAPAASDADPDVRARLTAWLDEQSERHRFLLYEADREDSPWTRRALRQADRVLIVAEAAGDPRPGALEQALFGPEGPLRRVTRELVLLHPDGSREPSGTRAWVEPREVALHHHVRLDRDGDVARVARFLAGRAVALVCAGGGAKGFAHIGVVRALRERRIPVDLAAGTSMGSIVAAAVATDWPQQEFEARLRSAFTGPNPIGDYDPLPLASLVRGRRLERHLQLQAGTRDVLDLWLPFVCVSSNLSSGRAVAHRSGPLWKALRASISIPGVLPPVAFGDDLHIDGGTFDNLPADAARACGAGRVIVSSLAAPRRGALGYERPPDGWKLLLDRHVLRRRRYKVPGLVAIVIRATMLASVERAHHAEQAADLCFCSPVHRVGFVQWKAFDAAADAGYRHACEQLDRHGDAFRASLA